MDEVYQMKIIVRIGGSVVVSPLDPSMINCYLTVLRDFKNQGHQVVAVVGGGKLAREFIKVAKYVHLENEQQDWAAIHVSRLFAQLFTLGLADDGCGKVPTTLDEAQECVSTGKIVVMGGLHPGITTDAVAALVGERIKADLLVKCSNVSAIYTKDPNKYPDAKRLDKISFEDLANLLEAKEHTPGINQVIDPEAVKILGRIKLKTIVVNGHDPGYVVYAVQGRHIGTVIE